MGQIGPKIEIDQRDWIGLKCTKVDQKGLNWIEVYQSGSTLIEMLRWYNLIRAK